jgi:hypothetical protein
MFKNELSTYQKIANHHNLKLTENSQKILNAKNLLGIGIYCPCQSDDKSAYCGSPKCLKEIKENGVCHCGIFEKS